MARAKTSKLTAAWAGFDLSTTGLALGVRSRDGVEAYAQAKMQGATTWNGQPAFDLQFVPCLILSLLDDLEGAVGTSPAPRCRLPCGNTIWSCSTAMVRR